MGDLDPTVADEVEPDALPSRVPCHNRRHHHELAVGARCFPLVPQDRPLPDRVVGTAAVVAVTGLGVAFCVGWAAGEWLATEGRLRLELARQRAADAWCRGIE
jgi:hypothetical protein